MMDISNITCRICRTNHRAEQTQSDRSVYSCKYSDIVILEHAQGCSGMQYRQGYHGWYDQNCDIRLCSSDSSTMTDMTQYSSICSISLNTGLVTAHCTWILPGSSIQALYSGRFSMDHQYVQYGSYSRLCTAVMNTAKCSCSRLCTVVAHMAISLLVHCSGIAYQWHKLRYSHSL